MTIHKAKASNYNGVTPGWCTGYSDYNGTMAAIKEAVKDMREEAKQTPTGAQYEREGA